jgi:hypothetical protein
VRDSGLCHAKHCREVAHAQLALGKSVKKSHSRRIAEHLEDLSGICNKIMFEHLSPHNLNSFFVYAKDVTDITHI